MHRNPVVQTWSREKDDRPPASRILRKSSSFTSCDASKTLKLYMIFLSLKNIHFARSEFEFPSLNCLSAIIVDEGTLASIRGLFISVPEILIIILNMSTSRKREEHYWGSSCKFYLNYKSQAFNNLPWRTNHYHESEAVVRS